MISPADESRRIGGRFVVEREVGRGGVGIVYRAYDLVTERYVALKVIAADAGVAPKEEVRLRREGELLAGLDHPGIVKIVSSGMLEDSTLPYVAMEWLDGEDVAARQRRDPLSLPQVVELARLVTTALAAAHDGGVVHRDIKPGNIFLVSSPHPDATELDVSPKLVDFGVAMTEDIHITVTNTGDVVGTPAYMAPEQARGDAPVDARSDIYSLGATLFELVAGRPPHVGPTAIATLARLVTTPPPRLSDLRPDCPPALDALINGMLATNPSERPQSADELLETLSELELSRVSWSQVPPGDIMSTRLGSGASRLVTTIVAIHFATEALRERALDGLRQRGADAVPLGQDAIVAHFGARHAVGTEAVAALDVGRRLARSGAQVGIASGRARVNMLAPQGEVKPVGEVVDRASSLARDAAPSTVLADSTTSELGRGRYEFRARSDGSSIVGDQLRAVKGDLAGGAPFVGREPELAQVMSAFERSRSDSTPIVVSVTGPPGIGKSRLCREVLARVSGQSDPPHVVFQRSDAYGRRHALGAAADVLRAIIELPKGTSSKEAEIAIVNRLGPATRSDLDTDNRALLASLLANEPLPRGLDPRGARDVLWLTMTDLVMQVVAQQATAIIMEDLQWADPESVGWLDHVMGRGTGQPLVFLTAVRPGFWREHDEVFAGRDHVRLDLRPVSKRATRTIAKSLLGEDTPDDIVDRIADQAGGLPLFAEELARMTASGHITDHAPTIESAIQASLDGLDDECRDAVGRLSVLGMTVWDSALETLGMDDAEAMMKELAAREVLVEQHTARFSDAREWVFKHALVREVAYDALGERERKELHALAAKWLSDMGEDSATVAGHFDMGDEHEAAAEHWALAAQRALATNALTDALEMADRALAFATEKVSGFQRASFLDEAWSRLDPRASDRETAIVAMEENVHDEASSVRARGARARHDDARGAGEDINERLAEARDAAQRLELADEEWRNSAALAYRLAYEGALGPAEAEAQRLLRLDQERGVRGAAVDGWQTLAILRQTRGAVGPALDARRNAAAAARAAGLKEREAMLTTNLGFALTTLGARQEARASLEAGLALGDAIGSKGAVRWTQMNLLGWGATFGNDKRLESSVGEARGEADAAATGMWTSPDRANLGMLFYRGWELLRGTQEVALRRARSLLERTAEAYRETGNRDVLPVALGVWAEAERRSGNHARSAELAEEAANLLESGAPSLLNESTVFVALHRAHLDVGEEAQARDALSRGMAPLLRRISGLAGTPYERNFLTDIPDNAALLAAAEGHGLVPEKIHRILERAR